MLEDDKMRPIGTHPVNRGDKKRRKKRINKRRKNKKRLSKALKPQNTKMYSGSDRYTFLYMMRPTLSYFCDYHEITTTHAWFLFGAYCCDYFVADELCEMMNIPYSWRRKGFNDLVQKGLIKNYINGNRKEGEVNVYKITQKGTLEVNRFCRIMLGEQTFPEYY